METVKIDTDIKVMYVTAKSFPDGVLAAHQALHSKIPFTTQRKYFGISRPENNHGIVYHAAAEELKPGEAEELGYETLVLKNGNYISQTITDYMKDLESIGRTFQELLKHPNIDPQGYCVELYLNDKDVKCMVRLTD
ncbi:transcriptional regulator [Solitalea sp. MAHUQ-68]|uniref:Transcriptional regulator n=1 Tax=Solitalea agri TaxID=2953739 RepID=A0A9X2F0N8_9SPHI|nr:transcriptional regulator [Solitalea agri]MCO4292532.1 transcriptional regulator [Solitalea agri]